MESAIILAGQASDFFAAWQRIAPACAGPINFVCAANPASAPEWKYRNESFIDIGAWRNLFVSWPAALADMNLGWHQAPFDSLKFAAFASSFTGVIQARQISGADANVWKVSGLGHDELRNSEVLAWFLSCFGEHGQGSLILEIFLEAASAQESPETRIRPEDVRKGHYWTNTESLPLGEARSRIDIEIESPSFLLFIEVKVRAPEKGDQLERYVELVRRKAGGRRWKVVFLTPDGREARNLTLGPHVSSISWKQFGTAIATHLRKGVTGSVPKMLLQQYADYLQTLS